VLILSRINLDFAVAKEVNRAALKSLAMILLTHPVYAALNHPLSGFAAKKVRKNRNKRIPSLRLRGCYTTESLSQESLISSINRLRFQYLKAIKD
jgi:hypothetical protein